MMMMNSPSYEDQEDNEVLLEAYAELFKVKGILDRMYKKITTSVCVSEQYRMSNEERIKFQAILERHKVLFDSELGH